MLLRDLRPALRDVPREALDRALLAMQEEGRLLLYHMDNAFERTREDDEAAIDISGAKRHLLYMEAE